MPIRFRCAYCNQLLGIARRKAGQVVRCPTCAGQVVVPSPEGDEESPVPPAPNPPLFERSDFDDLLNAPASEAAAAPRLELPAPLPEPGPAVGTARAPLDVGPAPSATAARPAGIVLSPMLATVLTVGVILAVAIAFGAGWLVR